MTHPTELDIFCTIWDEEAGGAIRLMEALPPDQYDFRPDPEGRSLGELAWHLSEIDACLTFGIAEGRFSFADEPPDLKRPREVPLLAPGYQKVHEAAVARVKALDSGAINRSATFFDGRTLTMRQILWGQLLYHLIHHRGQLVLMCRLAGGVPPGLFGPNREEMRAMQEKMKGNAG
jgi:uncharacterized damage-inducible protein DinB